MKRLKTILRNLYLFATVIGPRLPFWRYPAAWRTVQEYHRQQVAQDVLTLRLAGKVRQDEDGRLFWIVNKIR